MVITINDKQYNVVVNGTVGLMYLFTRMTGEEFDAEKPDHILQFFYIVLVTSNPDEDIKLDTFIASMTRKNLKEMGDYITQRFIELEGEAPAAAKKKSKAKR